MNPRDIVIDAIRAVAPELSDDELTDDAHLQQDLDLDSMDVLDVVTEISQQTGVEIPESDYGELHTIGSCAAYVGRRVAA